MLNKVYLAFWISSLVFCGFADQDIRNAFIRINKLYSIGTIVDAAGKVLSDKFSPLSPIWEYCLLASWLLGWTSLTYYILRFLWKIYEDYGERLRRFVRNVLRRATSRRLKRWVGKAQEVVDLMPLFKKKYFIQIYSDISYLLENTIMNLIVLEIFSLCNIENDYAILILFLIITPEMIRIYGRNYELFSAICFVDIRQSDAKSVKNIYLKIMKLTSKFCAILPQIIMYEDNQVVCEELVKDLLNSKINCILMRESYTGKTALYAAVSWEKWNVVDLILDYGQKNLKKYEKFYLLCQCIVGGDYLGAKLLLSLIEDVDFSDMKEITPLRLAVMKEKWNFVELLINSGASVGSRELPGILTILQEAVDGVKLSGNFENIDILLKYGVDSVSFQWVCRFGDEKDVQLFLNSHGLELGFLDNDGSNALMYASGNRRFSGPLKVLLKLGIFDVNYRNKKGRAAIDGRFVSVSCENAAILLRHGAKLDRQRFSCYCIKKKVCPIAEHFRKLKLIGYTFGDELVKNMSFKTMKLLSVKDSTMLLDYGIELLEMSKVIICSNPCYSLFDLIFSKRTDLMRFAKNTIVKEMVRESREDFEKRFPHYGHIILNIAKEWNKREDSFDSTKIVIMDALGSHVPVLLVENIVSHLADSDLEKICQSNRE